MTLSPLRNPLILDTDGGVDDAQALILLLSQGVVPQAITTVFGNVSLDAATRNILDVLEMTETSIPVYKGLAQPLVAPIINATNIHGDDGLGGAPRPSQTSQAADGTAVEYLIATLRAALDAQSKIDLLMIGPLSNLAIVLRLAPECIDGIGHLWIMGGTLNGRGNTTPATEFNVMADPEAAQIVFAADIATTVTAWEVCENHYMHVDAVSALIDDLPDTPLAQFNAHLLLHARAISHSYGSGGHFLFVDPLAAAVLADPSLVTKSLKASVDVALAPGLTRGMTLVDPSFRLGTPPVTFVETVDNDRICALFTASVKWAP